MRFRFTGNGGEIDLQASYTPNDPFYELVTALQAVYDKGFEYEISVNEEPAQSILKLGKFGDKLLVTLEDEKGARRTQIKASFQTGYREIARNIYHLYREVGYGEFVREWKHSPPRQRIKQLWKTING